MAPTMIRRWAFATRGQSTVSKFGHTASRRAGNPRYSLAGAHHRQTSEAEIAMGVVRVGARERNTLRFRLQEGGDHLIVNGLDRCGCGERRPEMIQTLDGLVDCPAVGIGGVGNQTVPRSERAQRAGRGTADRDDIERAPRPGWCPRASSSSRIVVSTPQVNAACVPPP